ncbi:hypothetical protein [Xenorhabdus sp. Sc-CR9]|uniref:hypothetical protein n=1 Tax=Xenorhabdus sp. Sc-CR9 TaxID=2584468 RepID=UPI001F181205|nr:hypothetical protein [Xenorhabdus sp. Sc-CR9]
MKAVISLFHADLDGFSIRHALSLFKRLVQSECGAYWTWLFYTGNRYFIGGTPEKHIEVNQQSVLTQFRIIFRFSLM